MADKSIMVGTVQIGGGAPISVQTMTNTRTDDVAATVAQIKSVCACGCDIVRVAVPDEASARAIFDIKSQVAVPIVADIHFDYRLALLAAEAGADKIRINPGNIGGEDNVRLVAQVCREKGIPIRIGVNGGSLEKALLHKHGGITAQALLESALGQIQMLNRFDFDDICISVKSSDVLLTVEACRLLAERTSYPLHLGVTEAGTEYIGIIKNSAGIGSLLSQGIGDTIRYSLTAPPENEVTAGVALLRALGIRKGANLVSCPTCGRTRIDLIPIAGEVERRLSEIDADITVAVMGCAVNGPGEARNADYGIAGGDGEGVLFKKGQVIKKVPMDMIVTELFALIDGDMHE